MPHLTNPHGTISGVSDTASRGILARNLKLLIEKATPIGERPSVRAWALSKGLDVRMIDRLTKGQHAVTLDKLEEIANACGLRAWHLLLEEFEPGDPPDAPITAEERATLRRLRKLLSE